MAISLSGSLALHGDLPLDDRTQHNFISDLKAYPESFLPDVFIGVCLEDGNAYLFDRRNEVDESTGRWRKIGSGADLSPEDRAKIDKIGTWTELEIESVANIIEALNKLNNEKLGSFTVTDKTLNILDKENTLIQSLDLTSVAAVLSLGDFKDVTITDIKDRHRLVYDAATTSWINIEDDILPAAKEYTDDEIAKLDRRSVIPVDAKPSQEDAELDVIYVYPVGDEWYQTVYVEKAEDVIVEITEKYLGSPNFDDYVHKDNDSVDTYAETYADETKFPKVKLIAELQADMNEKIGKKVNIEDIVDDLESEDVDKPLSANQGRELKELIEESAGGIFDEEMGTTAEIGGLPAGSIITDWSDHKVLQKILFPYVKPGAKLTISPTTVLYKIGETVSSLVLSCLATKNSEPITSVKFFKGTTELEEITDDVATGGTFTHTMADDITVNTTLKATVSDGTSSVDSTVTIKFVNPIYYGCTKVALAEKVMEKGKFTYDNITCNNDSVVVKYDASWGNLKSILDASSFESIDAFTKSQEVIGGVTYNVYTLTIPATLSGFKYTFSF